MLSRRPRGRARVALLLAAVAVPLLAPLAATPSASAASAASAADTWTVPPDAVLTLTGHGYGHGHGMSQYGAEGAARQGLDHREILDFYYPDLTWGRRAGRIDVLVGADTTDDLVVRARPGLTLRDTATGELTLLPDKGASLWRVQQAATGATRVSFRTDRWRRWRELEGDGELAAGGQPLTLVTPGGDQQYRGRLRAATVTPGSAARDTVNDMRLEAYLRGVVPREVPASWSPAAVRAQAVAARTYAAYERLHPRGGHFDVYDTTASQVYGGVGSEHPASDAAIADTAGQVLLADGSPAFTQFSSSSGGWTSAGSVPYLVARADPYDDWAGNPVHDWSVRLADETLERRWPAVGDLRGVRVTARDGNGEWGGRVTTLVLSGTRGSVTVSGDGFRSALGLRSTWFTVAVS
ncbi:SpoIID/LytB domain-containing protein [Nocardioides kribbensis]|uniref:SpoIID/LytB domain-containing protein n=1 Tax=Nocardioides kribbensis TaxID=305517 RepID=UPI0032DB121C